MLTSLYHLGATVSEHLRGADGQTLAEYGILITVIAIVVLVVAIVLGASISSLFSPVIKDF